MAAELSGNNYNTIWQSASLNFVGNCRRNMKILSFETDYVCQGYSNDNTNRVANILSGNNNR